MKNKITVLLVIFSMPIYSFDPNQSVKLGPLSLSMKYCEQVDKISSITNSLTNVKWPVTGAPGITMGLMSKSNTIIDFCNYLGQLSSLDKADKLFKSAEYLNKLTGAKMDDTINLSRSAYDMNTVVLDESGKSRPMAEILTAQNASRFNSFYKEVGDYYDNHLNSGDPVNVRSREQIESDMNRLNVLTYQKAKLDDITNCPTPNTDNSKAGEVYEKDIIPVKEEMTTNQGFVDHYAESLRRMGFKFTNEKENKEYIKELNNLVTQAQRYDINIQTRSVKTVKREKVTTASTDPMDPKIKEVNTKINQKYQSFSVIPDRNILDAFIKKWNDKWKGWTMANIQTEGLLSSAPTASVYDEFVDWDLYCNRSEIRSKLNEDDPRFQFKLEQKFNECKETQNKKITQTGGLFKFYSEELFNKNQKLKEGQATVWTFESYWFGYFRTIDGTPDKNGYAQEKVSCSPLTNMAAMQNLMLKQENVNNELNQMLVEQAMKANSIEEARLAKERADKEEQDRKEALRYEAKRRQSYEYNKFMYYPDSSKGAL